MCLECQSHALAVVTVDEVRRRAMTHTSYLDIAVNGPSLCAFPWSQEHESRVPAGKMWHDGQPLNKQSSLNRQGDQR